MLVVEENTRFAPELAMRLPRRPNMVRQWREARAYAAEGLLHDIAAASQLINVFLARLLHLMVRARGYKRLGYVSFGSYVRQGLRQQGLRRFEYLVAIQRAVSEAQGRPELEQLARDWPRGRVTVTQARQIIWATRGGEPQREPAPDMATEDDERWERRRFSATQAQHTAWLGFLEICQRVEGADLPVAQCVDDLLAEFSSTLPLDSDVPAGLQPEEKPEAHRAARAMRDAADLLGEIRRAGGGVRLAADPLEGVEEGGNLDAADLDRRIRWLLRLEGNISWHQCRLLYIMARLDLHRRLGFRSLAAYAREALDCSPAALAAHLGLARRLEGLPRVADAFRTGLITALEAAEICKVAVASTQSEWIERARTSTVRVLQDDVAMVLAQGAEGRLPPQRARAGTALCAWQAAPRPGRRQEIQTSAERACPIAIMPLDAEDLLADAGPKRTVAFSAPASVCRVWDITLGRIRGVVGADLRDGQCVAFMLADFLQAWLPQESRRHHVLVRDGWRCQAPGCAARAQLHAHHIVFRSRGGFDDTWNLVTVCLKHHALIHAGAIGVSGRAGAGLTWEMGINAAGRTRERFEGGLRVWADPDWSAAGPIPAVIAPDDWRQTSWVLQRS